MEHHIPHSFKRFTLFYTFLVGLTLILTLNSFTHILIKEHSKSKAKQLATLLEQVIKENKSCPSINLKDLKKDPSFPKEISQVHIQYFSKTLDDPAKYGSVELIKLNYDRASYLFYLPNKCLSFSFTLDNEYELADRLRWLIYPRLFIFLLGLGVILWLLLKTFALTPLKIEIEENNRIQRKLETAIKNAEKANQVKGQFLANMSHEIRTPINAVIGFSELLSKTRLTKVQEDFIQSIQDSGKVLSTLVNDILDLSKAESGHLKLENISFDLEILCNKVIQMLKCRLLGKPVEIIFSYDQHLTKEFEGDPTRIRQVLLNLISNAIKFTEEGLIEIKVTSSTESDSMVAQKIVLISVADTGIGIPSDMIEFIFHSFHQGDTSTTRKYGGSGLGLAICHNLVNKMNGTISVTSAPGEGSHFLVNLPLKECLLPQCNLPFSIDLPEASEETLLVCSLNKDFSKSIESILGKWFKVKTTLDLKEHPFGVKPAHEKWLLIFDFSDETMSKTDEISDLAESIGFHPPFVGLFPPTTEDSVSIDKSKWVRVFKPLIQKDLLYALFYKTMGHTHPQIPPSPTIKALPTTELPDFKNVQVLAVEDNPINMKLLMKFLEKLSLKGTFCNNGEEALKQLDLQSFDIILMDLQMPIMDGIEATKKIREKKIQTPIIALTANSIKNTENYKQFGFNDYMTKPISMDQLKAIISFWTQKKD